MAKANEIKRGDAVTYNGKLLLVKEIDVQSPSARGPVSFSYIDGDEYVFMDNEDYTPFIFKKDQIEEELLFIPEGGMDGIQVLMAESEVVALELPQTVELEIIETSPSIKGASASARTKPATLSTGLVIQVPEYIDNHEKVKIHIAERRYMSRAE